ncbi:MAG: L,D-transpeptidase [Calothrix sp. SM1_5_4]|nr:L,D-transpeptidase [Calothrix sp. SM1_5_4]
MKIRRLLLWTTLCVTFSVSLAAPLSASGVPQEVRVNITRVPAGGIVVRTRERALYLKLDEARAIRFPVAVPKSQMQWQGFARINGKHLRPAWVPPAIVKRANPDLPDYIPGGHPSNPMGAAALTLNLDEYAIHGTSPAMRGSIGMAASFGCVRMLNEDVLQLYQMVSVGTPVYVGP